MPQQVISLPHPYSLQSPAHTFTDFEIDSLTVKDLLAIQNLDKQLSVYNPKLQPVLWDKVLASSQYIVYGVFRCINGTRRLIGNMVIGININEDFTSGNYTIHHIAVQNDFRKQGHAEKLMGVFAAYMNEAFSCVNVAVDRNSSLLQWWEKFGFVVHKMHLLSNVASMQVAVGDFAKNMGCLSDDELAELVKIPEIHLDQAKVPCLTNKVPNQSVYDRTRIVSGRLELLSRNSEQLKGSLEKYRLRITTMLSPLYVHPLQAVDWLQYKNFFGAEYLYFVIEEVISDNILQIDEDTLEKLIIKYMQACPEQLCLQWCLSKSFPLEKSIELLRYQMQQYQPIAGNYAGFYIKAGNAFWSINDIPVSDRFDFVMSMQGIGKKLHAVSVFQVLPKVDKWESFINSCAEALKEQRDCKTIENARRQFVAEVTESLFGLGISEELKLLENPITNFTELKEYEPYYYDVLNKAKIMTLLQHIAPDIKKEILLRIMYTMGFDYVHQLSDGLNIFLENPHLIRRFQNLTAEMPSTRRDPITLTLLVCAHYHGVSDKVIVAFCQNLSRAIIRDNQKIIYIIQILKNLNQWMNLDKGFIEKILANISSYLGGGDKSKFKNVVGYIIFGLSLRNSVAVLHVLQQHSNFDDVMRAITLIAQKEYAIPNIKLLIADIELILQIGIHKSILQDNGSAEIQIKLLEKFIPDIFNNTFSTRKYDVRNAHVDALRKYPLIYAKWRNDYEFNLPQLIASLAVYSYSPVEKFDCKTYLIDAVLKHKHLAQTPYSAISELSPSEFQILMGTGNQYEQETFSLLSQLFGALNATENLPQVLNILVLLQRRNPLGQFAHDIDYAIGKIEEIYALNEHSSSSKKEFVIDHGAKLVVTGKSVSLFRAGLVVNSCQSLEKDSSAPLMTTFVYPPHVKILALYNDNKLVARCKLSLLLRGQSPVLHLEGIYTDVCFPRMEEVFVKAAKEYAKHLQVDLVCARELKGRGEISTDALRCIATIGTEYVDSSCGKEEEGFYTIEGGTVEYTHVQHASAMTFAWGVEDLEPPATHRTQTMEREPCHKPGNFF